MSRSSLGSRWALLLGLAGGACGDDVEPLRPVWPRPFVYDGGTSQATLGPSSPCQDKRVKALYFIPGDLTRGEGTRIEAQFVTAPARPFTVAWSLWNDEQRAARGTLRPLEACQPGSASCARFTCLEPRPSTAVSSVWVVAKYEDDLCYEITTLLVPCMPAAPGDAAQAPADPSSSDASAPAARDAGAAPVRDVGAPADGSLRD